MVLLNFTLLIHCILWKDTGPLHPPRVNLVIDVKFLLLFVFVFVVVFLILFVFNFNEGDFFIIVLVTFIFLVVSHPCLRCRRLSVSSNVVPGPAVGFFVFFSLDYFGADHLV
jgi:hypothetical protein